MSAHDSAEPLCSEACASDSVEVVIDARPTRIGSFPVRRLLPSRARRLVGPFVYLDHMGPLDLPPGAGADVLPHPHIGLATVTWLFEGEIVHRDSLGSNQTVRPGDLNWMTAGRGIVHSERTPVDQRRQASRLHGLQIWVALPRAEEEREPEFAHYPAEALPTVELAGARARVLVGRAFGAESPVRASSPMVHLDVSMRRGCSLPVPSDHDERALYVVEGVIRGGGERAEEGRMLVFRPNAPVTLEAETDARAVLIGGAPIDGPRHILWNFVSSSRERIERAKRDWVERRFEPIPGDSKEFVPLPEGLR